jgi:hypothetical protein
MPKTIEELYDSFLADADAAWEAGIMEAAYHALGRGPSRRKAESNRAGDFPAACSCSADVRGMLP